MKNVTLTFVVNGSEIKIQGRKSEKLIDLVQTAIKKSLYDSGRHVSEFQINMKNGTDSGSTLLKNYNPSVLKEPIFITLKAGIGA